MKRLTIFTLVIFCLILQTVVLAAETGRTQAEKQENLYVLAKVWGFVKYYHPVIAAGEKDWDQELLDFLPQVENSDFRKQLVGWVKAIGPYEVGEAAEFSWPLTAKTDMNWISDWVLLGNDLSKELSNIYTAKRTGLHHYVKLAPGVGNPVFQNEKAYKEISFPDEGMQLLSLFRYWNMVNYFAPYNYLMDENWDSILRQFIPRFLDVSDGLSYRQLMAELIKKLQDSHAYMSQGKEFGGFLGIYNVPVQVSFIENKAVIVRKFPQLSADSKLQIGDVITAVNGVDIETLVREKIRYTSASNHPTHLREVAMRLMRTNETSLKLSLEGGAGNYEEEVATTDIRDLNFLIKDVPAKKMLGDSIGYIYPGSLKKGEITELMQSMMDTKGVVVDLRCYPSDFILFSLGGMLVDKPTPFARFSFGNLVAPGHFILGQPLSVGSGIDAFYQGKVVILINEMTQSLAEYTAMALSVAPKSTVIGSTTAGADGNISYIILPGNVYTAFSGIGVYYPDGSETQRIGIVPDIPLKPTVAGIRAGRDELLEKAISVINN